jgi:hypothetical protein
MSGYGNQPYEAYNAKQNNYSPSLNAVPVMAYAATAQPNVGPTANPMGYVGASNMQSIPVSITANTNPRPPMGQWKDGICDWPKNLFPSCYCACCFFYGFYLMAQSTFFNSFFMHILLLTH